MGGISDAREETGSDFHDAFSKLYLQYYPEMKRMLQGYTDDRAAIEDLVQDVFTKLWSQKEQFRTIQSFKSYAFRVLRNGFLSQKRKQYVHQKFAKSQSESLRIQPASDVIETKELRAQLHACLLKISPTARAVFLLNYYQGYDSCEIAHALRLSERTVKNLQWKVKKQLKEMMERVIEGKEK